MLIVSNLCFWFLFSWLINIAKAEEGRTAPLPDADHLATVLSSGPNAESTFAACIGSFDLETPAIPNGWPKLHSLLAQRDFHWNEGLKVALGDDN